LDGTVSRGGDDGALRFVRLWGSDASAWMGTGDADSATTAGEGAEEEDDNEEDEGEGEGEGEAEDASLSRFLDLCFVFLAFWDCSKRGNMATVRNGARGGVSEGGRGDERKGCVSQKQSKKKRSRRVERKGLKVKQREVCGEGEGGE